MSALATQLHISPELHPGYTLRRPRGKGGFGEVWEAETRRGERVALKFLPGAGGRGTMQELRSITVVQNLQHPHLVKIEKVWCAENFLVVAMELADGSLMDLLDVYLTELDHALPREHLLPLMAHAAKGVDFLNNCLHRVNEQRVTIQHCDVTPNNLLIFGRTVKLSDFGLTTTLANRHKIIPPAGTPAFAAPEVFQGRVSDRSDQYSLAVCYCLLRGGRLPFPDTPMTFEPDYVRPVPDLEMLTPKERDTIARAFSPVPTDRWPSCAEMVAAL